MRRTIIVYATLLGLALIAAYLSWTSEPDTSKEDGVVLLEVEAEQIESVHYVSAELDVMLTARDDERGRYLWAKLIQQQTRQPEPEKQPKPESEPEAAETGGETGDEEPGSADTTGDDTGAEEVAGAETGGTGETGAAPAPESEPEPEPEPEPKREPVVEAVTSEFVVGVIGDELLENLGPLRAKRSLDEVSADKLEEFGLADAPATLTIGIAGHDAVTYEVGESGFGTAIMYLREPESGRVYVVDPKVLTPLTQADKRLPNRTLFAAKPTEVVAVEVAAEDASVALEHRNREDPERQFWAIRGSESGDETAQAWLQKFFRLRALSYVPEADQPAQLLLRFRVRVVDAEDITTSVEVLSGERPDGEQGWYARSEHTRGLVELSPALAEESAQDIGSVLE